MKKTAGLRARVMLGILLLATLFNVLGALAFYFSNLRLQISFLDAMVKHEEAAFAAAYARDPSTPLPDAALINVWFPSRSGSEQVPPTFAALRPGLHHDIVHDGRTYHVNVTTIGPGRAWFAFDVTEVENQETKIIQMLTAAVLIAIAFAGAFGFWLSRHIVAPLTALTEEVGALDPAVRNVRLSPAARGGEIQIIADAFERYLERLDRLIEREASFTSAVSHELRTPLSILSTSAEILAGNKRLDERAVKQVARIRKSADEVSRLVTSLLALARDTRHVDRHGEQLIDLREFCEVLIEQHRPLLLGRAVDIELRASASPSIACFDADLSIVLGNLLRNAIAYTDTGLITITIDDRSVRVHNPGEVIDAGDLEHVFECYYSGRNSSGSGLGLYLAKRICDRHEWTISLTSVPGMGVTAVVGFFPVDALDRPPQLEQAALS